jgi:hypothetical protein
MVSKSCKKNRLLGEIPVSQRPKSISDGARAARHERMSAYYVVRGRSPSVRRRKVRTEEHTSRLLRILRVGRFFYPVIYADRCPEVTIHRLLLSVGCEHGTKRSDGAPVSNIWQVYIAVSGIRMTTAPYIH